MYCTVVSCISMGYCEHDTEPSHYMQDVNFIQRSDNHLQKDFDPQNWLLNFIIR
jgi:hypothetical protein